MGCGLSNTIWNNYKNLPPYTPDEIVKHGPGGVCGCASVLV